MFDISAVRTLALKTTDERTNKRKHLLSNMRAYLSAIACASLFAHERKFSQHGLSTFLLYFFPCPALYFSLFIIIMNVLFPCISFSYFLFYLYLRLSFSLILSHTENRFIYPYISTLAKICEI